MLDRTSIAFVRHGHVYNPGQAYYGRLPGFPLSKEGRRQARLVAKALREWPVAAVYSSPQLRAVQTAGIIRTAHRNVKVYTSALLDEACTPFDGHPVSEVAARNWDVYTGVDAAFEQPADILARTHRFISCVRERHAGCHVVAVTHGDIIAFALIWLKGMSPSPEYKQTLRRLSLPEDYPAPASVYTFVYDTHAKGKVLALEYMKPY